MDRPWHWILFAVCSLVAHAAIILALVSSPSTPSGTAPGKSAVEARKEQTRSTITRERVTQASQQVQRISSARIQQKLESLRKIEKDLAEIETQKKQEYSKATEPLRQNALENATGAMKETVQLQEKALSDLKSSSATYEELARQYEEMLKTVPPPPSSTP